MTAVYYAGFRPLKKWILSLVLLPLAVYFIWTRGQYTLLDHADLFIHEAGHFFFSFFGNFIRMAGGTLMQILFPLFLAGYFLWSGYRTAVQIFVFWLGQNLINISVYAADARVRKLRLLGGGKHDWFYMLRRLGMLDEADVVGNLFFSLAITVFVLALVLPLLMED